MYSAMVISGSVPQPRLASSFWMAVWGGGVVNRRDWVKNCTRSRTWKAFARSVPIVKPNGMIEGEERGDEEGWWVVVVAVELTEAVVSWNWLGQDCFRIGKFVPITCTLVVGTLISAAMAATGWNKGMGLWPSTSKG